MKEEQPLPTIQNQQIRALIKKLDSNNYAHGQEGEFRTCNGCYKRVCIADVRRSTRGKVVKCYCPRCYNRLRPYVKKP